MLYSVINDKFSELLCSHMAIWLTAGFLVVVLVVGFANIECLLG